MTALKAVPEQLPVDTLEEAHWRIRGIAEFLWKIGESTMREPGGRLRLPTPSWTRFGISLTR